MTTAAPRSGPGGMSTFNILHGFPEALIRGMRNSFLGDSDYHHLTQCDTLEDVKLNLTESDYAESLADLGAITPNQLQKAAIEKVREREDMDFQFTRSFGTVQWCYCRPVSPNAQDLCRSTKVESISICSNDWTSNVTVCRGIKKASSAAWFTSFGLVSSLQLPILPLHLQPCF